MLSATPRYPKVAQLLAIIGLFVILAHGGALLLGSPLRGMADNGDFWRVAQPAGLASSVPVDSLRHRFIVPSYAKRPAYFGEGFSSAALLVWVAANAPWADGATLELQQIGALYVALIAALFAIALFRGVSPLVCALVAWVLVDPGYLLFCNSLYADPCAMLGVLGVVVGIWHVRRGHGNPGPALVLVVLGVFLASWSKQSHFAIGLAAALPLLAQRKVRRSAAGRLGAFACILLSLGSVYYFAVGPGYRLPQINNYNAVFFGIGDVASEPAAALAELGVGAEYRSRAGTNYYEAPVPDDLARQLEGLSHARLARLYLRDSSAMGRALNRTQIALAIQDRYLGNYTYSWRYPGARVYDEVWAFTHVRQALLRWPIAFWAFLIGLGGWLLSRVARRRELDASWGALAFLWLTIAAETASAVLGDGFFGLWRHVIVARFALDIALAIIIARLLEWALRAFAQRDRAARMAALNGTATAPSAHGARGRSRFAWR